MKRIIIAAILALSFGSAAYALMASEVQRNVMAEENKLLQTLPTGDVSSY